MNFRLKTSLLLILSLLAGCFPRFVPDPSTASGRRPDLPAEPTHLPLPAGLTVDQFAALNSLQKVDDYPLYTMTYTGTYPVRAGSSPLETSLAATGSTPNWACSLFTVLLDNENLLYGRNFDWQYSPALLLFTNPPDGYASASMVDIEYLGFTGESAEDILALPIEDRTALLDAPSIPFDGMNEHGLAIGMAAVPSSDMQLDPGKARIGSLGIIRQVLDRARDVDEAVEVMKGYNIDFTGGPPIHYLIADANGKSVLVEYYDGKMQVFENEHPWHLATNFLHSTADDPKEGNCWRYNTIAAALNKTNGRIDARAAMRLLAEVAQDNTQWSVIYRMSSGEIDIVMGQQYQLLHQFQLEPANP